MQRPWFRFIMVVLGGWCCAPPAWPQGPSAVEIIGRSLQHLQRMHSVHFEAEQVRLLSPHAVREVGKRTNSPIPERMGWTISFYEQNGRYRNEFRTIPTDEHPNPLGMYDDVISLYDGTQYQFYHKKDDMLGLSKNRFDRDTYFGANPLLFPFGAFALRENDPLELAHVRTAGIVDNAVQAVQSLEHDLESGDTHITFRMESETTPGTAVVTFNPESAYYPTHVEIFDESDQLISELEVTETLEVEGASGELIIFPIHTRTTTFHEGVLMYTMDSRIERDTISLNEEIPAALFHVSASQVSTILDEDLDLRVDTCTNPATRRLSSPQDDTQQLSDSALPSGVLEGAQNTPEPPAVAPADQPDAAIPPAWNLSRYLELILGALLLVGAVIALVLLARKRRAHP